MKPAPFELHRPQTVDEALSILGRVAEEGGLILAGGQSLVPMMALRVAYPPHLVDINAVDGLDRISVEDGWLAVGATTRHARFHQPVTENGLGRLLTTVAKHIAHYPIRMRGTMCGSLAHADPASEWCLTAVTLDAEIILASRAGRRSLAAKEYLLGALTTARAPEEMLLELRIPLLLDEACFGFYEFNRRAGDFALGMSLATYQFVDGVMAGVRIGVGGIEEKPRRIAQAEQLLEGRRPEPSLFAEAGAVASENVDPLEDATTSADYRRDLTAVVVKRALAAALSQSAERGGRG